MKKTFTYYSFCHLARLWACCLAALLLFGACEKEILVNETDSPSSPASYLEVVLDLGQAVASRAETSGGDATLQHGEEQEYQIHDACLLLFAGNDANNPDNAIFIAGAHMSGVIPTETKPNDHISRRYRTTIKFDDFQEAATTQYWALVIANPNNLISVTRNSFTINSETHYAGDEYKYSAFKALGFEVPIGQHPHGYFKGNDGYLLMTNALLYNNKESELAAGAEPMPVPVNVTGKFTPQPTDDEEKWAIVYLERTGAKVNVQLKDGVRYNEDGFWFEHNYTTHFGAETSKETFVTTRIIGWNLVNINVNAYLIRHWDSEWLKLASNGIAPTTYRFLGSSSEESDKSLYRVNYSQSAHYDETLSVYLLMINQYASSGGDNWSKTIYGSPRAFWNSVLNTTDAHYCSENTMPAAAMMVKNATLVNVCVHFAINPNDGGDFYIINGDKANMYDLAALKAHLATLGSVSAEKINLTTTFAPEMACGGPRTISTETVGLTDDEITSINSLNGNYRIECYKGGNAFYLVPIAHFGDDLTPWHKSESPSPEPIEDNPLDDNVNVNHSYPSKHRDANYLGRWGVVRNNWYVLTINGIKAIGDSYDYRWYPEVIKADRTPLDYYDSQLQVKIQVKPWTLRDQSVTIVTP